MAVGWIQMPSKLCHHLCLRRLEWNQMANEIQEESSPEHFLELTAAHAIPIPEHRTFLDLPVRGEHLTDIHLVQLLRQHPDE